LAIDASENAKNAFDYYMDNVHKPDDTVVLSHIPEAPKLPTFSFKSGIAPPVEEWKKVIDDMNARTRKLEEDYEGNCIQKKLRYKVRGEAFKNPGEGICRIAEEEGASLIILGTRGLNAVKRALLGSVSEYVCRHAGIPTLIVPGPNRKRSKSRSGSIPEAPKARSGSNPEPPK
jgi:nucleotide-binding universal stress UspA family protein